MTRPRGFKCRSVCALRVGGVTLLACGAVHRPGSSLSPVLWGFYGGFLTWYDRLFTPLLFSDAK